MTKLHALKSNPGLVLMKNFLSLQNKCTQYWPDPETTKICGPFHIRHMKETEFTDYILREFELTSESDVSILSYHNIVPHLHCVLCDDIYSCEGAKKIMLI